MSTRRTGYSKNKSFLNNIRDYIVPIIGFFLIIFLVYLCVKKPSIEPINTENQKGVSIEKDSESSAVIFYQNGKKDLEEGMELYKGERIKVSEGRIKLNNEFASFNLKKLGDLAYLKNGNFSLDSGDIWIDATSPISLDMRFIKLKIYGNSHISLSQNEVNSTVYVVSGKVEVINLAGKNTVLLSNEKIEVSRSEASNEKIDLSTKKESLGEIFLKSDWFIINNGNEYIGTGNIEETSTGNTTETSSGTISKNSFSPTGKSKYLILPNLIDESNVSESVISIIGSYDKEEVSKVEINGKEAVLNSVSGTFKIEGISVGNKSNDLIFKVFDAEDELKEKFVYTVYNDNGTQGTNIENINSGNSNGNVFNVDGSKFSFTAPTTSNTYTTYEGFITIRGAVSASNIDRVTVNDFKLNSFNGKTWRYHASVDYGNLSNGTNVYEIKYYSGVNLVYKNYFTIIKKDGTNNATKVKDSSENVNLEANSSTSISY